MITWRTLACCAVAVLATACGDDEMIGSGNLSGGNSAPQTGGESSTGFGSSSGGGVVTTGGTTEGGGTVGETSSTSNSPTTTSGSTTGSEETTTAGGSSSGGPGSTSGVNGACGNGAIDANEQCDGGNLNGFTCEALGNAGGTLGCDPMTCTFDTSLCEGGDSGGTSN